MESDPNTAEPRPIIPPPGPQPSREEVVEQFVSRLAAALGNAITRQPEPAVTPLLQIRPMKNDSGSAAVRRPIRHQPSREVAWQRFTDRLAAVLAVLDEDDRLCIDAKHSPTYVQFAAAGIHGMRIEAVGNYYRSKEWQLDENQLARMADLGWARPNVDEPSPEWIESDPDFAPNFHLDAAAPVPFRRVADLAVTTLRDVYRVPHPGSLEYAAFGRGTQIKLPTLGLLRRLQK